MRSQSTHQLHRVAPPDFPQAMNSQRALAAQRGLSQSCAAEAGGGEFIAVPDELK